MKSPHALCNRKVASRRIRVLLIPGVQINQKADLRRRPSGHAAFGRVGVPIEPADLRPTRRPDPTTSLSY
jgi:hypothetical protein